MKVINIYTDGACAGNQNDENLGGWGCVLEYNGFEKELHGGEVNTTNNRMELTALVQALSALKEKDLDINIYSDSSYLINCFKNRWIESWKKNGWKNSQKKPVENRELWESLVELLEGQRPRFFLIKGHQKLKEGGQKANSAAFKHFKENNGSGFTYKQFAKIVDYNNRCDALANVFIKECRETAPAGNTTDGE